MTILCIGKTGQVASALDERAVARNMDLRCIGRPELDLLDAHTLSAALEKVQPSFVVNAAAYTNVDGAEVDEAAAFALNAEAPGVLAKICKDLSLPLLHISTDYVFDGTAEYPYRETDEVAPINAYGRSKLAGEHKVRANLAEHIILRTSWVYGPHASNFVTTMLRLARERGGASVVDDQIGAPTSALDIADAILAIAKSILEAPKTSKYGTFHFTSAGSCSWADFADLIFTIYNQRMSCNTDLKRIPSSAYPTPAMRPNDSRLSTQNLTDTFGIMPDDWTQGVTETVNRLLTKRESVK